LRKLVYLLVVLLPACSGIRQISDSGFGAFEADIEVLDANTVAVAWYDTRHPGAEIYLRLLDRQLKPVSAEFRLSTNDTDAYEVDIVALGKNIAATWYEIDSMRHSVVKLGLWNRQGRALWVKTLTKADINARIPVIEANADELFVAWLESPADDTLQSAKETVVGIWVDADGSSRSDPITIAPASPTTWNLNIELASTENSSIVFLAYDSEHETLANELYLAQIADDKVSVNRLSDDDGCPSKYPDIAFRQGQLALTWFDNRFANNEIYTTVRPTYELLSPRIIDNLEPGAMRISHGDGDSIGAYLAWNGASLGLAWSDGKKGRHNIYFQRLDRTGKPQSKVQRLTQSKADSLIPSINAFASGFVLAWNEVTVNAYDSNSRLSRAEITATVIE